MSSSDEYDPNEAPKSYADLGPETQRADGIFWCHLADFGRELSVREMYRSLVPLGYIIPDIERWLWYGWIRPWTLPIKEHRQAIFNRLHLGIAEKEASTIHLDAGGKRV